MTPLCDTLCTDTMPLITMTAVGDTLPPAQASAPEDSTAFKWNGFTNPGEAYLQLSRNDGAAPIGTCNGTGMRFGVLSVSLASALNNMGFPFLIARGNTPYPAPFSIAGVQGQIGNRNLYISTIAGFKSEGNRAEADSLRQVYGFTGGMILGEPEKIQVAVAAGGLLQSVRDGGEFRQFGGAGLELRRYFPRLGQSRMTLGINAQMARDPQINQPNNYQITQRAFIEVESPAFIRNTLSGIGNAYLRRVEQKNADGSDNILDSYGLTFGGLFSLNRREGKKGVKKDKFVTRLLYETKLGISGTWDSATNSISPNIEVRQTVKDWPKLRKKKKEPRL